MQVRLLFISLYLQFTNFSSQGFGPLNEKSFKTNFGLILKVFCNPSACPDRPEMTHQPSDPSIWLGGSVDRPKSRCAWLDGGKIKNKILPHLLNLHQFDFVIPSRNLQYWIVRFRSH